MADSFNFFSDRPVDYGAQYRQAGYAGLGQGIAGGLEGIAANNQKAKDFKMKADLEQQMKIDDEERRSTKSLMDRWAEAFPGEAPPLSADGKTPNTTAMMGKLGYFERVGKPLQEEGGKLGVTRPVVNVPGQRPGEDAIDGDISPLTDPTTRPGTDAEFATAIEAKKSATKLADADAIRKAGIADATAAKGATSLETIKALQGEFPEVFGKIDTSTMTPEQAAGMLPQMQGQANALRLNQKDSMQKKNIEAMLQGRGLKPGTPEYDRQLSFGLRLNMLPNDAKHAAILTQDMVRAGIIAPDDYDEQQRQEALLLKNPDGKPFVLPHAAVADLTNENTLIRNLGGVQKQIAAFEQKYGQGAFDGYVGDVDNRTNKWTLRLGANPSEKDKEAGRIAQLFQGIYNADLKSTSGGAVTESEALRKAVEAGTLDSATFKNTLQGWKGARQTIFQNKQKALRGFTVPDGVFDLGEDSSTPSAPAKRPSLQSIFGK